MIKKKITLVLGAGSSCNFGFPLGGQLRMDVLNLTRVGRVPYLSGLKDHPLLEEFVDAFRRSRLYSIDAFLGMNSKYTEVGKRTIAAILMLYEEDSIEKLNAREQDWHDYLWNKIASGHSWDELDFGNLSVVTFNYDRSFETFLTWAVQATYGVSAAKAVQKLQSLKIVHVYGDIGSPWPENERYRRYGEKLSSEAVLASENWLKVIPEARDDEPTVEQARQLLRDAGAICFLGFGFDALNLRRLDAANTCCDYAYTARNVGFTRIVAASCIGLTSAEAVSSALACKIARDPTLTLPRNFVNDDCLNTLRQTLILG